MAKLFVIGGSGFFGKSILSAFQRGVLRPWNIESVLVLARSASRLRITNPELVCGAVDLIDGDIATCKSLPPSDYVIHAAASTDISRYLSQPIEERLNIQGSILNYCRLAPRFHKSSKIVYASSGAIYGPQHEDTPFLKESDPLGEIEKMDLGKRHYAAAKRDAESAMHALGCEGIDVSVARCFAFVGPYLPRDLHFAVGNFIADGIGGRPIKVNANKYVYRSYMYADDLVEWLMTIAANGNAQCPVYNVGSREAIEVRDLAKIIGKYFGVSVQASEITDVAIDRYIPSVEKAYLDLGLTNKYDILKSLAATIHTIKNA